MEILDASYILHSNLDFSSGNYVTTNSVLLEINNENARVSVESALKKGMIKIQEPKKEFIEKVQKEAEKTGDLECLSNADIEILALALETKYKILTDDYAIQNVAASLGLKYEKFIQRGIKKRLKWIKICEGCKRRYSSNTSENFCSFCGSLLKKVPITSK
ncbi:MAG: hypothetical protein QXY62_03715 [Candidatus Altiarchaeota archaeon]